MSLYITYINIMSQKNKKRGKNTKAKTFGQKRDIIFAEDDQIYATVTKMLGNCRVMANCSDGKERLCHIRGKLKKRIWIREGSVVLLGLREFEDDKADIIHVYMPDEIKKLIAYGEIDDTSDKQEQFDNNIAWDIANNDTVQKNKDSDNVSCDTITMDPKPNKIPQEEIEDL